MSNLKPHEVALSYLGVPFRHRGRTRNGLDCIGLIIMAARECGMEVFDQKVYGREPWRDGLRGHLRAHFGPPVERPIEVDDVLLLRLVSMTQPSHVAIVAPHPHGLGMVHTYGEIGHVAFHRIDAYRRERIIEAYEWPEKY